MPYTTRWRRLSSITRAPCRKVMGMPGQVGRRVEGGERNLIVLDSRDVLHDAFAVSGPGIDAEGEVSSCCAHVRPFYRNPPRPRFKEKPRLPRGRGLSWTE